MPYRRTPFAPGEFFHLCGRGNNKQLVFLDRSDYVRFLFSVLHFQSPLLLRNVSRFSRTFEERELSPSLDLGAQISRSRDVELISFALMPNHYHLLVRERKENGISKYMERVLKSFTKYFNAKHKRVGHLFQGPFRSTHIVSNEQLLYASTYIHRNPCELPGWRGLEHTYPWSSYTDVTSKNRFAELLAVDLLLEQFPSPSAYRTFCAQSPAKDPLYLTSDLEVDGGMQ